jgi:hypothetical protein
VVELGAVVPLALLIAYWLVFAAQVVIKLFKGGWPAVYACMGHISLLGIRMEERGNQNLIHEAYWTIILMLLFTWVLSALHRIARLRRG